MKLRLKIDRLDTGLPNTAEAVEDFLLSSQVITTRPKFGLFYFATHRSVEDFPNWARVIEIREDRDKPALALVDRVPDDYPLCPTDESCRLWEMIGDYSQTFLECSYNEDELLAMLLTQHLNT